ncbi:hypothetical protein [Haloferula sp. BvORR071]|uniref:hypothetical protein n=1 Tax=Haloferula sp. BvORR071 TaxID=1396141 RepID=UPI00054E07C4|nr:hypothetical protein [Haloferula sp. BvORR071]
MAETISITQKRGDTWAGWSQVEILVNDEALDLTGAAILMQFRRSHTSPEVAKEFSTGNGITITAPTEGKFSVAPAILDMVASTYVFDVQLTLASGRVLTPISGTFTLTPDVSR